jgi:hypothetical protein
MKEAAGAAQEKLEAGSKRAVMLRTREREVAGLSQLGAEGVVVGESRGEAVRDGREVCLRAQQSLSLSDLIFRFSR